MDDVATSQPPPAADGGSPWGSFYTATSDVAAPTRGRAKRKRSAEPTPEGEPKPEGKKSRRARGSRTGGGRRAEDKRRSFRLQRRSREDHGTTAPAPVATAAPSRRYAEPHVLVGVVGGTVIALAALMIALLYMIGTAA